MNILLPAHIAVNHNEIPLSRFLEDQTESPMILLSENPISIR